MEGDIARSLQKHLPRIAHVQLADNPGRNEPGTGEINFSFLFRHLDAIGEHLRRTGDIEQGHPGKGDDRDTPCGRFFA
jgi:hypothetical protein